MSSLFFTSLSVRRVGWPLTQSTLPYSPLRYFSSQTDENKIYLLDTMTYIKRMEAQGFSFNQAESITSTIIEALNSNLGHMTSSFMSKSLIDEVEVIQNSNMSQFKSKLKNTQDNYFASQNRDIAKVREIAENINITLTNKIEKRITECTTALVMTNSKLDKEISELKGKIDDKMHDVIIYGVVGICVSVASIATAAMRVWK